MNWKLFNLSLVEIAASLIVGLSVLFISSYILTIYARKKYKVQSYNLSYALIKASILFSMAYLMESVLDPLISTFRYLSGHQDVTILQTILYSSGYLVGYFMIAAIYAGLTIIISLKAYTYLSTKFLHIVEIEEIRNNNLAVGLITGIFVIIMSILLKQGLALLIESLIPIPEFPKFN